MKKNLILLLMMIIVPVVRGQSLSPTVLATAGTVFDNGSFSLSWTVGEVATTTLTAGNIMLTQGFHQGPLIASGIKAEAFSWQIQTFPNPVTDMLTIRFDMEKSFKITLEVRDLLGRLRLIQRQELVYPGDTRKLDFNGLSEGIYILRVMTPDKKTMQTYKIIKH